MIAPTFRWVVNQFGAYELTADSVPGRLAYVCKVLSLTPGKPIGCSIDHPGWSGESQTYHRDMAEGRAAAEVAVLPYVEQQLAARREALVDAAARAIHRWDKKSITWDDLYPDDRTQYRSEAECVIDAIDPLIGGAE